MDNKIAILSDNNIKEVEQLENKLGVVLVAYDKEESNDSVDKRLK